jgi:hypothetical protein
MLITAVVLDRITIPEASAYIREHVPQGQIVKLVPGGHMAILEQHERVPHLVGQFAAACTLPPNSREHAVNPVSQ